MVNKTLLFAKIRERHGSILAYSKKSAITREGLYAMKHPDYKTIQMLAKDLSLRDAEIVEVFFPEFISPSAPERLPLQT